jgi:trimeric autotransporter adhesin
MRRVHQQLAVMAVVLAGTVSLVNGQSFLTNGLINYYPFNGNADDAVGTNNGTVVGAVLTSNRFGLAANAYSFNGSSYIQCPDSGLPSGNSPRTVSLWVKVTSFGSPSPTITYPFAYGMDEPPNQVPSDAFYAIVDDIDAGAPYIAVGKSGGGDTPQWHGPSVDVWYHVAVTYSNSIASLFVDGANLVQAPRIYGTTLTGHFYIGRYLQALVAPTFYGVISDVRVYNRALSSSEVQQLYLFESSLPQITSATLALHLNCTNLIIGGQYQIQTSPDLKTWKNYGSPFIAPSNFCVQYVDMASTNGFFRLLPQ